MRAKLIKEDSKKILKGKSGKEIINSRVKIIEDFQKKFNNALELIKYVSSDYQLEKGHPDYMGFLNVGVDMFYDNKLKTALQDFVDLYNENFPYRTSSQDILDDILKRIGIQIDGGADGDEIVFSSIE